MAIVTLEDLQGTIEVVVFPRLYETDAARPGATARSCSSPVGSTTGRGGLAAGRPRASTGTTPSAARPEAFAREVAAGDRGARSRRRRRPATATANGNGNGGDGGRGRWSPVGPRRAPAAVRRRRPGAGAVAGRAPVPVRLAAARRRRATGARPPRCRRSPRPSRSRPTASRPARPSPIREVEDEPAFPDEARARIVADGRRADPPDGRGRRAACSTSGSSGRSGRPRWSRRWRRSRTSCATRPGETRVVVHIDVAGRRRPADGAPARRRLRRGAAGRGPAPARRRARRAPPRERLTTRDPTDDAAIVDRDPPDRRASTSRRSSAAGARRRDRRGSPERARPEPADPAGRWRRAGRAQALEPRRGPGCPRVPGRRRRAARGCGRAGRPADRRARRRGRSSGSAIRGRRGHDSSRGCRGARWRSVDRPSPALLADLGRTMGRVAAALVGLDHPAAHRPFQWDVGRATDVIAGGLPDVDDPDRRALLARTLDGLRRAARPDAAATPIEPHPQRRERPQRPRRRGRRAGGRSARPRGHVPRRDGPRGGRRRRVRDVPSPGSGRRPPAARRGVRCHVPAARVGARRPAGPGARAARGQRRDLRAPGPARPRSLPADLRGAGLGAARPARHARGPARLRDVVHEAVDR